MTTVGEILRRERLRHNLALDQVSSELKISTRFLDAIENEQFDKLPGGVFAKAFVRQYARMLGLDEEELAGRLQEMLEPPPVPEFAERGRPVKPGVAPIQVPRMEEWQTVGDQRVRWSGSLSAAIMVVVVMLICSAVYAWWQRPRNPVFAHTTQPPVVQTAPPPVQPAAPPVQSEPAATAPPATEPPASASTPAVSPPAAQTAQTAPANPDAVVHVAITANQPVWVLARADGKFSFTGTMEANQTRTVDAVKEVYLRLGNAGGVTITLNGKPVGPVGPKGQPRTVQFTSGGFQIVPAKPPSVLDDPIGRL